MENNNLTTYQIYLMLLGYLIEQKDNTEMLKNMLVELYRRANKAESEIKDDYTWLVELYRRANKAESEINNADKN